MSSNSDKAKEYAQSCQENCQWLVDYLRIQFTEHPAQVNQTWGQHCIDALCYSGRALAASGALFVHAFVPCWCQEWGGDQIDKLQSTIRAKRACKTMIEHSNDHPLTESYHEKDN